MYRERARAVADRLAAAGLDALLVTHPPNLRFLAGFDGSTGALLLTPQAGVLLVDGRYLTGASARVRDTPALSHISIALAHAVLDDAIADAVRARDLRVLGIEGAVMTVSRFKRLVSAVAPVELQPTERLVESVRVVKDDVEIAALREGGRRLSAAAAEALEAVQVGRTEAEVAAAVELALRRAGFSRPAFETIVASGPNSALPHARPTSRRLEPGDGVVLDFGGVYDGYCVDLTRTVQLGPPTPAFERIFAAVRDAQAAAIAAVRPGTRCRDVDGAARRVLEARGLGEAFVHGTGHGLGLEVHEEPRITRLAAEDDTVRAGMVFTIEPGAYVPGVGGVRLEDDVVVTADGCEMLTAVPIDLAGHGGAGRRAGPAVSGV